MTTMPWKKLFLFCSGLAAGTAVCMKWLEAGFLTDNGKFTILGLELFYSREKVTGVLHSLTPEGLLVLRFHLGFDFAFMAGVYPGLAALCMIAAGKAGSPLLKRLLYLLALLQLPAWVADGLENYYLLGWLASPAIDSTDFAVYHGIVILKWVIALLALLMAAPVACRRKKRQQPG
ncbi:MAG: hypothetical protein ABW019_00095 [Chitinophagaceae bacterium]